MTELDENFDGIAESRSTVGDGKLGLFSPEKQNLAKIWSELWNLPNVDKISGILDKKHCISKKFPMTEFWFSFGRNDGIWEKFDGEVESGTP